MSFHGPQHRPTGTIDPAIGHNALAHDLAMWFSTPARGTVRGRLTWENIQFPDQRVRPDVYSLVATLTHRKWCPVTHEVKVGRGDFTTEIRTGKWRLYRPFSAYIFFACIDGLIGPDELPPEVGLIVRRPETWVVAKKGKRNSAWSIDDRVWMNLCLKDRNPSPFSIHKQRALARLSENPP